MEGASSHVGAGGSGGPGARRGDGDGDGDAHTRPLAVIEQQQHKDEDVVFDAALVAGWELEQSALPAAPAAAGAAAAGADAGASAAVKTEAAALPLPAAVAQEAPSLEEEMTLIVTTSVAPLNPLTEFIQDVVASYALHEPSLLRCRKIIVCDWPQVRKGPSKFRVGKVNADALAKYEEYVAALRALAAQGAAEASHPFHRAEVMVLGERQGFALAVGHALRATSTPFVMVVQHDRRLTRPFGLPAVMAAFRSFAFRNVNYLCLSTSSSGKNPELEMERSAVEVRDHVLYVPGTDVRAVPMSFWLDSTHIARADFYRDFTLESHCINQWKWCTLKAGDFIEDKFGNLIRSRVSAASWCFVGCVKL